MIRHIVMHKMIDAEGRTAMENAVLAKEKAEKLIEVIPTLRKMEAVINSPEAEQSNFNLALICDFDDMAGLNEYMTHPEHKKYGSFIAPLRAEGGRACIDYEI